MEDDVADDEEQYVGVLEDIDPPRRKTKAGRPVSGILDKISQLCRDVKTKARRYRCLGSRNGINCKKSWASPRNRLRVLKHACHCSFLSAQLKAEVNNLRSGESLGAILEKLESDACAWMEPDKRWRGGRARSKALSCRMASNDVVEV